MKCAMPAALGGGLISHTITPSSCPLCVSMYVCKQRRQTSGSSGYRLQATRWLVDGLTDGRNSVYRSAVKYRSKTTTLNPLKHMHCSKYYHTPSLYLPSRGIKGSSGASWAINWYFSDNSATERPEQANAVSSAGIQWLANEHEPKVDSIFT